mgnify:CR=1 FL=1
MLDAEQKALYEFTNTATCIINGGFKATKPATFKERYIAFKDSFWALFIIVVVIGGI